MPPLVLRPVVEAPLGSPVFWCPLPAKPWPDFIALSGSLTDAEVALVLLQFATYNSRQHGAPLEPAELAGAGSLVLPGGLMAVSNTQAIAPSCCCGLENWTEWYDAARNGSSPWMGHDPSPWLERRNGTFHLWPDEATRERSSQPSIQFTQAELEEQLALVPELLSGFVARMREVLLDCAPAYADALVAGFERTFVRCDPSEV